MLGCGKERVVTMKSEEQRHLYARMECGNFAYQLNPFSLPSVIRAASIVLSSPDLSKSERWFGALYVGRFYVLSLWFCSVLGAAWWLTNNVSWITESTGPTFIALTFLMIAAFVHLCICALFAKPKN